MALRADDRFCPACGLPIGGSEVSKDPLIGRTIGGSYVVLDLVGVGGMGRVYRAEQRMLGRTVAIKVIHPHLLADEQSVARFYNEARAASRLNHPNSVSIIDFGRTDDGILYLAMEYLQGRDLARIMREDGFLPIPRICELFSAVLAALGEAHVLGVVHRDLKPENVIVERLRTGTDLVKVVDFGLAKLLGPQAGNSVTSPGLVCGTPDYMSPEQGRGLPLDGRGDIYSVAVILFELLTEQLPYIADTPTNVVLRHIQDPIPDPRDFAPERNIPDSLANIVLRGLEKSPTDRFQTAEEMADALRRVLSEVQPASGEISCPSCDAHSPANKRFCAECGAALQAPAVAPAHVPRLSMPPRVAVDNSEQAALTGRDVELHHLLDLRRGAFGGLLSVCIIGEAGIGKTRFLAEVAERATLEGDLVVGAGPHDSGAVVSYHPIRTMLLSLLDCDTADLSERASRLAMSDPLVAAGMREVVEPSGLRGAEGKSRAGAVAAALAHGLREALSRTGRSRSVLIADDLHRYDGLSAQVLGELRKHTRDASILLLTTCQQGPDPNLPADTQSIQLRGLSMSEARSYMGGYAVSPSAGAEVDERTFVPLYLEQLRALGLAVDGVPHTLPARLADAVSQRLQRLSIAARRVLQVACVLGNRCSRDLLLSLSEPGDQSGIELLRGVGLLVEKDGQVDVAHPFIRDLVEASIPAEARKALHARALEVGSDAPLEVRAHHAYGAGENLTALMLLERMGDLACERGDAVSAVLAYRRAVDLIRRELLESGDTSLGEGVASFSRKLGHALSQTTDLIGAEGVLREALEYCEPRTISRVLILLELGRVLAARKRPRDATRILAEALEGAIQRDDPSAQAAVHMTIGEMRRAEGNLVGAEASFSAALREFAAGSADVLALAKSAVELASTMAQGENQEAARDALDRAQELAADARAPYLEARAASVLVALSERQKDPALAQAALRKAWEAAARAGDAEAAGNHAQALARNPTLTSL